MRKFIFIIFLLLNFTISAQRDSLDTYFDLDSLYPLPEINVIGFNPKTLNENTQPLISIAPKSLSEILNNMSHLSLKNYGPGSLSTFSLRGHSSSQTDIILDGYSIQSNMNGVYDLSLLPSFFIEQVKISNSPNLESTLDAIGGSLQLKTDPLLNDSISKFQVEYITSLGSYLDFGNYLSLQNNRNKNAYSTLKAFYRSSKNNFPFTNINQIGTPRERLPNSSFQQYGIQQNNLFFLPKDHIIKSQFWWLKNHRDIPPTLTESQNGAFQNDQMIHGILSWKKDWSTLFNSDWSVRYMNENIYYDSPITQTDSRAQKIGTKLRLNFIPKSLQHQISGIFRHEYSIADVDGYELDSPTQHRTRASLFYQYQNSNIKFLFSVEEEIMNKNWSPFLFSTSFSYFKKWNKIQGKIKGNLSRNYRLPTFNDLYWNITSISAGNPNLVPEKSWKESLEFQATFQGKNESHLHFNLFNSNVDEWILWAPNTFGTWTPQNVKKVWSRGIETEYFYHWNIQPKINLIFNGRYTFTKTTNEEVTAEAENTLHQQVMYVPLHAGNLGLELKYKSFSILYQQMINGKRYIKTDNSNSIPTYSISNIQFSYRFHKKNIEIEPVFEIRNLFNQEYQVVVNRPQPPLNFQGTIYFRFN